MESQEVDFDEKTRKKKKQQKEEKDKKKRKRDVILLIIAFILIILLCLFMRSCGVGEEPVAETESFLYTLNRSRN